MKISLQIKGLEKVQDTLRKLSGSAVKEATVKAINDTAFEARKAMQNSFRSSFDRPTPFVINSVQVDRATDTRPYALVGPTQRKASDVDPGKPLAAEASGGPRRLKRSEVALQRAGVMPAGYFTVIPKRPFPGSDDGRGNISGPFISMLLAYFASYQPGGRRKNMGDRKKASLAEKGIAKGRAVGGVAGVAFFVSNGQSVVIRGVAMKLPFGIWARVGANGEHVRPVLLFVSQQPSYQSRISSQSIVKQGDLQAHFERRMRFRLRQAAGV